MSYYIHGTNSEEQQRLTLLNTVLLNEACLKELSLQGGEKILDVGCGTCDTEIQLASKECKVVGIDLSSKMLLVAADKIPKDLNRIFLVQGLAENLAFRDNQFDYVISEFSLDYLDNPKVALKEFTRVLKRGGKLLFIVSNGRPLYIMFWEFLIGNWGFIKQLKHRQCFLTFPCTGGKSPSRRYTIGEINDLISDLPIKTLGVFGTHGISGFLGYPLIILGLFIIKMRKRGTAFKDIDHYVKIKGDYLISKIFKIFEKTDQRFNNIGRDIIFVGEKQ